MNYLTIEHASKTFGDKTLFSDITVHINKGDKVALIAKNGTGKTTLLHVISGVEEVEGERSKVFIHPSVRIGYLPQMPNLDPDHTVMEAVFEVDDPKVQLIREYEIAVLKGDEETQQHLMMKMDEMDAWDTEARIHEILAALKISETDKHISMLSGGEKKRVALARILIRDPEFFILDEPTNHLDLVMIEWLERYLSASNITVFMVTHDRYFLENVCNTILELDKGKIYKYKGSYGYYLEKKSERTALEDTVHDKARKLMKKELEWVRRMPKARGTKAKSRIKKFEDIREEVYGYTPEERMSIPLKTTRLGSKIIEIHNLGKSFGDKVLFKNFYYKFKRGDRIGIAGINGSGKTTLIKLLAGDLKPDEGKVVIGDTVVFGHYRQEELVLSQDRRVIDVVREIAEYLPLEKGKKLSAEQLLEKFLFPRPHQQVYVSKLSGGEKRRLHLLTVLMKNPNVLILDEPTNDLDILTLNILEEYLMSFDGCLIIVSHDRYFMDKLIDHLFVLEPGGTIRDFPGTYTEYRASQYHSSSNKQPEGEEHTPREKKKKTRPGKELNKLDKAIAKLQKRKEMILQKFESDSLSLDEIHKWSKELEIVNKEIAEKEDQWLELSISME